MQTSFDRTTWKEDPQIDAACGALTQRSAPNDVRAIFPYSARATRRLVAYQIPEGEVFRYARCRHEMAFYPIVVVVGIAGDPMHSHVRTLYLSSDEVELFEP